jgi:hypothetical protein
MSADDKKKEEPKKNKKQTVSELLAQEELVSTLTPNLLFQYRTKKTPL